MRVIRAIRIHDDFINNTTSETVHATVYTDKSYTLHFAIGDKVFPQKMNIAMDIVETFADKLTEVGSVLWMVVEESYFKGADMDKGISILWIRFIGTMVECGKFVEKHETLSLPSSSKAGVLGGIRKVYEKKTILPVSRNQEGGAEEFDVIVE